VKVSIDPKVCTGHGLCYMTAPEVFVDDEHGYGQVLNDGDVAPADEEAAANGAANCPERAITIIN
jgi:ferredoxin